MSVCVTVSNIASTSGASGADDNDYDTPCRLGIGYRYRVDFQQLSCYPATSLGCGSPSDMAASRCTVSDALEPERGLD